MITGDLEDTLGSAIADAEEDRGGDWSKEREALKKLANRSRQLDQLIEAVELRMAIAAAYNPLPAERRRLGLLAGIPADAGTPAMTQLRSAANKKLEAVLATCKASANTLSTEGNPYASR